MVPGERPRGDGNAFRVCIRKVNRINMHEVEEFIHGRSSKTNNVLTGKQKLDVNAYSKLISSFKDSLHWRSGFVIYQA